MKNSVRKFIVIFALLSFCHLILTFVSIAVPFVLGAPRFDNPDLPVSAIEKVASFIFPMLIQPMMFIVHRMHLNPNGTILEWSLFLLNSLFWGFCLTFLLFAFNRRSSERI